MICFDFSVSEYILADNGEWHGIVDIGEDDRIEHLHVRELRERHRQDTRFASKIVRMLGLADSERSMHLMVQKLRLPYRNISSSRGEGMVSLSVVNFLPIRVA